MLAKDEVNKHMRRVYANNSSIEFVHLILIPIGNNQTLSTFFSAVSSLLNDFNTPSAHDLENRKVCNKFRNRGLSKQTGQVAQSSN